MSRQPLGFRFLQTMSNDERPPAGMPTPNYRCPSPIRSRELGVAARWNSSPRLGTPTNNSAARSASSTPLRAPTPVGRAHVRGPQDNILVGLCLNRARDPSPHRRACSGSSHADHLIGTGVHIDETYGGSTPRVRGKMSVATPSRESSPRRVGLRHVETQYDSPFRGLGQLGPDPNEKRERLVPPPMVLKSFRRGVKYVPEPNSNYQKPRYSDEEPFRHGKRFVAPYTREPSPSGVRTNLCERSRASQLVDFVGSPHKPSRPEGSLAGQKAREKHVEFLGTSIRCVSPHTPLRRAFNIISNIDC